MRKIIMFVIGLLAHQVVQAQGTIYLSNLNQTPTGGFAVGYNPWVATEFQTGINTDGYLLDSVQLDLADASGNPSGFTAMIYSAIVNTGPLIPGTSLGALNGSTNPSTAGIYTYTDDSNLILSPSTTYFIVLTVGTPIIDGTYEWDYAATSSYNPTDNWLGGGDMYVSGNGLSWSSRGLYYLQYAITATPIPEPSTFGLFGLGGLLFIRHRHKAKAIR